ncbi:hypothetical protein KV557_33320 [Kitasatospora aureofaciens]|uniref:hypothetical protein n=1 Tax=Kitasatospora aureofaciens TaxID=1894 RepID=UPI001C45F8D5|nr:hypothetical protein [Kitasatospora aureofaciens]MBV6701930.1 hypothetical protein [Kitasatospora aureofaciens]
MPDTSTLQVNLTGPVSLDRLDPVIVTVQNEAGVDHAGHSHLGGSPSKDDLAAVVWSPLRLKPGVNEADRLGRVSGTFALEAGDHQPLAMEPSPAPRWNTGSWERQWEGKPLRLKIECRRDGHKPWFIVAEVAVVDSKRQPPDGQTSSLLNLGFMAHSRRAWHVTGLDWLGSRVSGRTARDVTE